MHKRPIILLDQDGPLANFDKAFLDICAQEGILLHKGETGHDNPCVKHRFLSDCIVDKAERARARSFVEEQYWFESLEPTEGAIEGAQALAEVADVWICTKPLESNQTCRDEKAAWVRHHLGKEWESKLIITPNKGMVHGDILLDDAIKLAWMPYATWTPVVFPTPWNGEGSDWESFERWSWNDPIDDLLGVASL